MQRKELRIVYRRGTEEFAEALQQRLDGTVGLDSALWTEKDYLDCRRSMPEDAYVLFLGDGAALQQEGVPCAPRFAQYGMAYGWSGRRAFLTATERPLNGKKKIRAFLEYLQQQHPEITPEELETVAAENALAWADSLKASVNPLASVLDSMFRAPVSSAGTITALGRLQYKAAVAEFYRSGIADFLDE